MRENQGNQGCEVIMVYQDQTVAPEDLDLTDNQAVMDNQDHKVGQDHKVNQVQMVKLVQEENQVREVRTDSQEVQEKLGPEEQ